jgi:hypothetical protein
VKRRSWAAKIGIGIAAWFVLSLTARAACTCVEETVAENSSEEESSGPAEPPAPAGPSDEVSVRGAAIPVLEVDDLEPPPAPPPPPLSAKEQRILDIVGEEPFVARDGSSVPVESYLEQTLRDPDSLQFISGTKALIVKLKGQPYWSTRVRYRAKNGFGGYVVEEQTFLIRHLQVVGVK